MRVAILCLALVVSVTPICQARTFVVPDECATINEALKQAKPGDTVQINPGTYDESLYLCGTSINIVGAGADKVIIRGSATASGPVLGLDGVYETVVSGCTFEQYDISDKLPASRYGTAGINNSWAEIRQCSFRNSAADGIYIVGETLARVTECQFSKTAWSGISVQGKACTATLDHNTFGDDCAITLIGVRNGATCTIEHNSGGQSSSDGILISDPGTSAVIRNNTIADNDKHGIQIIAGAHAELENNTCTGNRLSGISVDGGAEARIHNNTCSDNSQNGIAISLSDAMAEGNACQSNKLNGIRYRFGATGVATNNTCQGNGKSGIAVDEWRTAPVLKNNQCLNNTNGICFGSGCQGKADANTCRDNTQWGILITDEGTTPEVGNNICENKGEGSSFQAEGLPISRQTQVDADNIAWLLATDQFETLEQLAARIREHQCIGQSGIPQLHSFYEGINDGCRDFTPADRETYLAALDRWDAAFPDSVTPKILRGMAHIEYAWDARGHGWASEVTEEGWQGFRSELKKAKKILTDTEAITKDDPHVYTALLTICRGESAPPKESEEIFLKGTSIVKDYDSLYSKRTCDLLPRWGGRPGEVKAFAERAVDTTRDIRGEAMYAVVAAAACTYVGGEEFAAYGFEWSRLNEAFGDMLEQFPESTYYLNAYCLIACYYDVETARALFESIGNQWDKDVWYSEETFNRHKTQINAPGSEPIKAKVISPVDAPVSEVTFIPLKYVVAVAIGLLIILVVSIRIILGVVLKN